MEHVTMEDGTTNGMTADGTAADPRKELRRSSLATVRPHLARCRTLNHCLYIADTVNAQPQKADCREHPSVQLLSSGRTGGESGCAGNRRLGGRCAWP